MVIVLGLRFRYLSDEKVFVDRPFKNPKCKEQEKFKVEAYVLIRKSLNFLRRRGNWAFFIGL
ncbi:hypothetical protein C6366_15565 [Desulfonatronum sp. SC1]|nr:hypothetical protein C6366_15565 [Desulfonatronum sp. SC1]